MIQRIPMNPIENPYATCGPALISFSGGRTSAFMLRQILDAHGGHLPGGVHVTFANTGKERIETLDFVHEVETRWSVPVAWLEYDRVQDREGEWHHTYRVVEYVTASRSGEPFAKLIAAKSYLPNPVTRFCTSELKIRVMKKYMVAQGYDEWDCILGLRADEPSRVHRAKLSCARERWQNVMPMAAGSHTLASVMDYWAGSDFDLALRQDEGNCDLCFLKGGVKIERLIRERPASADWWSEQERLMGQTFRIDRPSYRNIRLAVLAQGQLFGASESHEYDVCNCTD